MESKLLSSQNHRFTASQPLEVTKQTTSLKAYCWHRYFSKTRAYPATRFILEMLLLAWFLKIVVTLPISLLVLFVSGDPAVWHNPQQDALSARPVANAMLALVVAPILETMIGQWFPLTVVRQWTSRQGLALVVATLFFAGLHLFSWNAMIFVAVMPVGFVLAWSFSIWQRQSLAHAIGVTAAIHALHNAIALLLIFS